MGRRPLKPCCAPGCGELVRGERHCPAHAHLSRAWATSKRSQRAGLKGRPWRRLREEILQRDSYLCQCDECMKSGALKVAHEVDHIVPLSRGGDDSPDNLRAINRDCHKVKTQRESRI